MALSGSFTGTTNNQYIQPKITWSATQNTDDNYSVVTATLSYSRTNSGYTTSGKWSGSITINGETESYSTTDEIVITQNSNTVAMSATVTVPHNEDGKKSINISCTGGITDESVSLKSTYCSSDITLDPIPRNATITYAPDFTDLDNPTITYSNPAGNAVTHLDACISLTGAKDDIPYRAISKTGTSYTFNLTEAERNTLRNATTTGTREVSFFVRTIIGEQYFYYSTIKRLTIRETDNTKPSVTMTATLNNGNLPSKFAGMYIQGKSRLTIELSAQAKYGASIKSFSASAGYQFFNATYAASNTSASPTNATKTFTTDVIEQSGSIDVQGSAKDTREFTGTTSQKITVLEYSKPLVVPIGNENSILCYRSDGNGVRVGGSTSVWVKAKRSYYNLSGKNTCALQWRRKLITDAWDDRTHLWSDLVSSADTTTDEYNALIPGVVFDKKQSYSVQIRAIDTIGEYDIKTFEIPTQDVALHMGKGGKNVAIGTYCDYSEEYTFYSEWKAIFGGGVCIGDSSTTLKD